MSMVDTGNDSLTATSLADLVAAEIRAEMGRQQIRGVSLAQRMGENEAWVSRKVRGRAPITLDELARFADALGVDIHDLLPEREPAPYSAAGRRRTLQELQERRQPKGGSVQLSVPAPRTNRETVSRIGRGTPQLAAPPSMTPINRPTDTRPDTPGHRRATRLSPPIGGGDRP